MTHRLRSLRPTEPQTIRLLEFMTLLTLLIVEDICDVSSEITKTHGAPDRTFIGVSDMDGDDLCSSLLSDLCENFTDIMDR